MNRISPGGLIRPRARCWLCQPAIISAKTAASDPSDAHSTAATPPHHRSKVARPRAPTCCIRCNDVASSASEHDSFRDRSPSRRAVPWPPCLISKSVGSRCGAVVVDRPVLKGLYAEGSISGSEPQRYRPLVALIFTIPVRPSHAPSLAVDSSSSQRRSAVMIPPHDNFCAATRRRKFRSDPP